MMTARMRFVLSRVVVVVGMLFGLQAETRGGPIVAGGWNLNYSTLARYYAEGNTFPTNLAGAGNTPPAAGTSSVVTPAPVATTTTTTTSTPTQVATGTTSTSATADAYLNLGNGPFTSAGTITAGGASAWFNSNAAQTLALFNGSITAAQIQGFDTTVYNRVMHTFQISGINLDLTTDPTVSAAHSVSLVSNTTALISPSAIGMTNLGGSGFSFIDNQAYSAQNVDQLAWIAAHNISHELMLALGVGENYDTTGNYVDARNASLAMMISPSATFSPAAAAAINQALGDSTISPATTTSTPLAQMLDANGVPEPGSLALWALGAVVVIAGLRWNASKSVSASVVP